ncbi:DUF5753 domain-containing protein [Actinomadura sp. 21ATH]|uniref:DUF5753 domain-containing protein n=1 Tax=Actinomadura sp. 21ATH TaxID=1735444 RepID=UPI0035BF8B62
MAPVGPQTPRRLVPRRNGTRAGRLTRRPGRARSARGLGTREARAAALVPVRAGSAQRRNPPYLWILIDQEALENVVGGSDVMAGQLRFLLELAERDRVCIRVVPRTAGWHSGHEGNFQVMTVGGKGVSYAAAQLAGRLVEASDESAVLQVRFDEIGALALPRADSKALIKETLRMYE